MITLGPRPLAVFFGAVALATYLVSAGIDERPASLSKWWYLSLLVIGAGAVSVGIQSRAIGEERRWARAAARGALIGAFLAGLANAMPLFGLAAGRVDFFGHDISSLFFLGAIETIVIGSYVGLLYSATALGGAFLGARAAAVVGRPRANLTGPPGRVDVAGVALPLVLVAAAFPLSWQAAPQRSESSIRATAFGAMSAPVGSWVEVEHYLPGRARNPLAQPKYHQRAHLWRMFGTTDLAAFERAFRELASARGARILSPERTAEIRPDSDVIPLYPLTPHVVLELDGTTVSLYTPFRPPAAAIVLIRDGPCATYGGEPCDGR